MFAELNPSELRIKIGSMNMRQWCTISVVTCFFVVFFRYQSSGRIRIGFKIPQETDGVVSFLKVSKLAEFQDPTKRFGSHNDKISEPDRLYPLFPAMQIYEWNPTRKVFPSTSLTPYNEWRRDQMQTRALLYTPSGGMNNQIIELVNSINVAKVLNRTTVIIPQAASHSNFASGYLRNGDLVPMDVLFDFDKLEAYTGLRFVALNISLQKFLAAEPDAAIIDTERTYTRANKAVYLNQAMQHSEKPLVAFTGSFFPYWFRSPSEFAEGFHVHHAPFVTRVSDDLAREVDASAVFNAMHIRRSDLQANRLDDQGLWFLKQAQKLGWNTSTTLFIATNEKSPRTSPVMRPLLTYFGRVVFVADLPRSIVELFTESLPVEHKKDFFGVVEQEICARALRFLGTAKSTFSLRIHKLRLLDHVYNPQVHAQRMTESSLNEHQRHEIALNAAEMRGKLARVIDPAAYKSQSSRVYVSFNETSR